jgi:hypothetical protein
MPRIEEYCVNARAARLLEHDEEFRGSWFRCHQMCCFYNFATAQLQIPISIRAMMRILACIRVRVSHPSAHGLEPRENCGRHPALDGDIERGLLLWIQENAAKKTAQ